jgi:hypothetical protein
VIRHGADHPQSSSSLHARWTGAGAAFQIEPAVDGVFA